jgi:signal transduction histidine kinase
VPLHVQEKVIGTLALLRDAGRPEYTFEDRALLQILADQAALAITNSRLYQELGKALQEEKATHLQLLQAEKHMAMSRMIASVAHELNNPIQTIRNCLYLTQQDVPPDSNIHEYLDMAVSETQRVANLVANLRGVYRPGQAEEMVVVDLVKVLEEVKLLLEPHLQHERVVWNQSTQVGKVLVKGIPNQLKQVFLNICLNAIEAMQPKGGSLMVGLCIPLNSRQVIVSFTDDGSGISPQDLTKLFDPFFTTKDTGTGLGLSISYDIVRSHDGQIHVDSRLGEGATFEIQLPIADYE